MAEQDACGEGRLPRVFSMFMARCQRCNPAMTDNVTARLCLRGSHYKEGDGRTAGNIKAIIERRGRGNVGEEGKQALQEERVIAATDGFFTPPLPRDQSMTK